MARAGREQVRAGAGAPQGSADFAGGGGGRRRWVDWRILLILMELLVQPDGWLARRLINRVPPTGFHLGTCIDCSRRLTNLHHPTDFHLNKKNRAPAAVAAGALRSLPRVQERHRLADRIMNREIDREMELIVGWGWLGGSLGSFVCVFIAGAGGRVVVVEREGRPGMG